MPPMIELRRVSKYYTNKDTVSMGLSKIDLRLDMGEFVAITGESGSGKSTLLNVISGLDSYEEGEMFVCGEDTSAYRTEDYEHYRKTWIGNIFQDYNLINSYTVYQNIELAMVLTGRSRQERKARVQELLDLVGLRKYARTKASKLSGGQKQRVAIARALAKDAPIIVADEPTGNLDSESALRVMETLHQISKDRLVIIVTHNYEQAEPYVTRKITLHDGRMIEDKKIRREQTEAEAYADVYDSLLRLSENEPGAMAGTELTEADQADFRQYARRGGRAERNAAKNASSGKSRAASAPGSRAGRHGSEGSERLRQANASAAESSTGGERLRQPEGASGAGEERTPGSVQPHAGNLSGFSELRLGLRNTFNLPAKFLLLLIVYLFVTTAVIGQYASTRASIHQSEILGYNQYFQNQDPDRIVLKKADQSAFSEEDVQRLAGMDNIRAVVEYDLGLDTNVAMETGSIDISGPTYPVSTLGKELTIGRMPEKDNEVVLVVNDMSYSYEALKEMGEGILGKKYYLNALDSLFVEFGERLVNQKAEIVGVVFDENTDETNYYGYTYLYLTDEFARRILVKTVAAASKTTLDFNGIKEDYNQVQVLYPSKKVPKGEAYIFEDQAYRYFDEGNAEGKPLTASVTNRYFKDQKKFEITAVIKDTTLSYWLGDGSKKEDYDQYSQRIYISSEDYQALYDKGNFQISVFMEDEKRSEETMTALMAAGFSPFAIKDSLSDITGGYEFFVRMLSILMLFVEFVVLFFIAYAVIRLIMRSRNTYYSTLRILGASRRNTDNILRIELLTMMLLSYGLVMGLVLLIWKGVLSTVLTSVPWLSVITERLAFLSPVDYGILFGAMLLMSLLIARRYARNIFGSSAMNVYREEV